MSLVLVLAMVFSFATTAFAAGTSYADDDQIQNTEAVQVMTGMGIINGKGDNLFAPTDSFLRSEAAKIITYMKLGPAAAEALTGTTNAYTDVPADAWFAPFVKYATAQGIIAGNGDGTFEPEIELSREAWLKMLLTTIGYDAVEYGLVGNNWDTNAMTLAITSGLITAEEAKLDFNRDTAVLYAWHAMNQPMAGQKPVYVVTKNGKDYTFDNVADAYFFAQGETVQIKAKNTLGQQVYGLTDDSPYDDFGRKSIEWTNGKTDPKEKVVYASFPAEPVKTYTAPVTDRDLKADLGAKATLSLITVDGSALVDEDSEEENKPALTGLANLAHESGYGTIVEIYANERPNSYYAIVINTYAEKLGKEDVNPETGDVTTQGGLYEVKPGESFAKNDVISYNSGRRGVTNVTKLTGVDGEITATNKAKSYVRVDGEIQYVGANAAFDTVAAGNRFYYDTYGNIIFAENVPENLRTPDGYAYVIATQTKAEAGKGSLFGESTDATAAKKAKIITAEGEIVIVDVAIGKGDDGRGWYELDKNGETTGDALQNSEDDEPEEAGEVMAYYILDGDYVFESVNTVDVTIQKNTASSGGNGGFTSASKTIIVSYEKKDDEGIVGASVKTYTGIASFPETAEELTGAVVVNNKDTTIAQVICFKAADAVDPEETYALYLGEAEKSTTKGQGYSFLVNGESTTYYAGTDGDVEVGLDAGDVVKITTKPGKADMLASVGTAESAANSVRKNLANYDAEGKILRVVNDNPNDTGNSFILASNVVIYVQQPNGNYVADEMPVPTPDEQYTVNIYAADKDGHCTIAVVAPKN